MDKKTNEQRDRTDYEAVKKIMEAEVDTEKILNQAYRDLYESLEMLEHSDMDNFSIQLDTDLIEECIETIGYIEGHDKVWNEVDFEIEKMAEEGIRYYEQKQKKERWKRFTHSSMAKVASIVLVLVISGAVVVQAVGFDIFGDLVQWGKEQFRITVNSDGHRTDIVYNGSYMEFDSVDEMINQTGIHFEAPTWLPEGYGLDKITVEGTEQISLLHAIYSDGEEELIFAVSIFSDAEDTNIVIEKTEGQELYLFNNVNHDTIENVDGINGTWKKDNQIHRAYGEVKTRKIKPKPNQDQRIRKKE